MNAIKLHRALTGLAIAIAFFATLACVRADDANDNRGQLSASDYKFAAAADRGGMMEVNLGQLAAQKSTDQNVRQFGQHMADDHGKVGKQLTDLASRKGATLPNDLSAEQQREVNRLSNLAGTEFDKAYMSLMVKMHKKDLKAFQHAAANADDTDLRAFATDAVPMIQDHLKMAEGIEDGLKARISQNP
jgi:putative membrane protein